MPDLKEYRNMSATELNKELEDSHEELFNLRLRVSTKQLANHRELRRVKRKIARLKTLITEKELGIR